MLSDSQLAGGLSQIPYLLASVFLQPSLKSHHQVDEKSDASNLWVKLSAVTLQGKKVSLSGPMDNNHEPKCSHAVTIQQNPFSCPARQ